MAKETDTFKFQDLRSRASDAMNNVKNQRTKQKGLLSNIVNLVSHTLNRLIDLGYQASEDKKISTESVKVYDMVVPLVRKDYEAQKKDFTFKLIVEPTEDGKVKLSIPNKDDQTQIAVTETVQKTYNAIGNAIETMVESMEPDFKVAKGKSTNSTKKLSVTLQKVTSDDDVSIDLVAIKSNYDPVSTVHDLNSLLDNEDFTDIVLDAPTSFEITDDGDDYDIENVDDIGDKGNVYYPIIYSAFAAWHMLKMLYWHTYQDDELYQYIHDLCEYLMDDVDMYNYWSVQDYGYAISIFDALGEETDDMWYLNADDPRQMVIDILSDYINVIEYNSANLVDSGCYDNMLGTIDDYLDDLNILKNE